MKKSSWLILLVLALLLTACCAKNAGKIKTLMKTDRYHLIDTLRGFALINMFVYHTLWSMANIFHYKSAGFRHFTLTYGSKAAHHCLFFFPDSAGHYPKNI